MKRRCLWTAGFVILAWVATAAAETQIESPSVAEARKALLGKPGAKSHDEQGWTVIQDGDVTWTFAPAGHEAEPAVAKRQIVSQDGQFFIRTEILCEAATAPCDRLKQSFDDLNAAMMKEMEKAAKANQ
jgi:hypothetical protein